MYIGIKTLKKAFIVSYLIISVSSIILLGIFYYSRFTANNRFISDRENNIVTLQNKQLTREFDIIINDLILLAEHTKISNIWENNNATNNINIESLKSEYMPFSTGRGFYYDQIRFIDTVGNEIIRINLNSGRPIIVENENLQNKKKRFYFNDIMRLKAGKVYISPLDLNVEHGQIELPFKPMIRIGTPIYDKSGIKKGIVVINYLGKNLLNAFDESATFSNGQNILVNKNGYSLREKNSKNEWAFMFPDRIDQKFGKSYPVEWKEISKNETGQFNSNNGLFTYTTNHPIPTHVISSSGSNKVFEPSEKIIMSKDYYWKIISFVPKEELKTLAWPIWKDFILIFLLFQIPIIFISWIISTSNVKRINAEKALLENLYNLESKVIERTLELTKAKEKAEESNHLKSAFLTNMSHEIRTPMNGILGFSNLLKKPNITTEEKTKFLEVIEKSGNRLLNTINNIIDMAIIESGQLKTSISNVDINEQIESLFSFFEKEAENKGLKLSLSKSLSGKDAIIKTDLDKLYSILTNLIKNAIKFSYKGTIEFGYHLIEKNAYINLDFFVKDTGIGIPKNRQLAIFNSFEQADIEDKEVYEGSGLGLAIAKSYVEQLGGEIWVESEIGKGSIFHFTIPYLKAKNEIELEVVADENLESIQNLKLLIAEDDTTSQLFLTELLESYCKEILIAKNGVEAVDICKKHQDIDLILMDIKMPKLNGLEATQKIREFNTKMVIIAQTAYSLINDREKSLQAGCTDYISKPINKNALYALIYKYFKH